MITVGGFWYVTSAGNQAQATTAKSIITDAFLGLFVALFAFLILRTINPNLVEGGLSRLQGGPNTEIVPNPGGPTVEYCREENDVCYDTFQNCVGNGSVTYTCTTRETGGDSAPSQAEIDSHNETENRLNDAGVDVKDNFPVTSVANLPNNAVDGLVALKEDCPSCEMIVTGGTEKEGHMSHGPKIPNTDLRAKEGENDNLITYMSNQNRQPDGTSSAGYQIYTYPDPPFNGARVIDERGRKNSDGEDVSHFHIEWP